MKKTWKEHRSKGRAVRLYLDFEEAILKYASEKVGRDMAERMYPEFVNEIVEIGLKHKQ